MSVEEHKQKAPRSVQSMVITVSDTRTAETDKSGQLINSLLQAEGHQIADYVIVADEKEQITEAIRKGLDHPSVQVILINGGTGIAARDVTYETVAALLEKEMPGFGEIFRHLSYTEDIGSAAILSRAIAGTVRDKAIFAMPGSSKAVKLAMTKLILPELGHIVRELHKDLKS
jgi:molybdenum cofactor biosynthesis protein B